MPRKRKAEPRAARLDFEGFAVKISKATLKSVEKCSTVKNEDLR